MIDRNKIIDIANILKHTDFNLITKSQYFGSYEIGKIQECEIISILLKNRAFASKYVALNSMQAATYAGIWSPKFDLENGDIVIVDKDNNPIMYIDVKVSTSSKTHGSVDVKSLIKFGSTAPNHFYLLMTQGGHDKWLISGQKLYEAFCKNPKLMASHTTSNITTFFNHLNITSKGWTNKATGVTTKDTNIIHESDFIPEIFYRPIINEIDIFGKLK